MNAAAQALQADANVSEEEYVTLWRANLTPLYICGCALTWMLHDYFVTLEDEIRHIWRSNWSFAKLMFIWVRYYTIALLIFDVAQIHLFANPNVTNNSVCVAMDSVVRVVGAVLLWSVEIVMQLRIYALYNKSHKIALINSVLFAASISGFLYVLVHNAMVKAAQIKNVIDLDLPGCPVVHSGIEWAQWVPATIYEGVLFGFALVKIAKFTTGRAKSGGKLSLYDLVVRDNIAYFFGVACLLIFNNLMVVGVTHIPWFSYGPFHAAVGICTSRMLISTRKAATRSRASSGSSSSSHTRSQDASVIFRRQSEGGTQYTRYMLGPSSFQPTNSPLFEDFDESDLGRSSSFEDFKHDVKPQVV